MTTKICIEVTNNFNHTFHMASTTTVLISKYSSLKAVRRIIIQNICSECGKLISVILTHVRIQCNRNDRENNSAVAFHIKQNNNAVDERKLPYQQESTIMSINVFLRIDIYHFEVM